MGEGNYSDAHAFPYTYDVLNIGKMVGMPVPGTMTAVLVGNVSIRRHACRGASSWNEKYEG